MTKTKMFKFVSIVCVLLVASSILAYGVVKVALFVENPVPVYETADVNVRRKDKIKPLSVEERIIKVAKENNFKWTSYLVRLAKCESTLNPYAVGDSGKSRGLFQIHKGYHPTVSDEQAFSVEWSTKFAIDKINAGYQSLWSCDRLIAKK